MADEKFGPSGNAGGFDFASPLNEQVKGGDPRSSYKIGKFPVADDARDPLGIVPGKE